MRRQQAMEETILRGGRSYIVNLLFLQRDDEVFCGLRPIGESELEAGGEETARDDLAAFEDEFGFGAHEEGADLDHPGCCGEADAGSPGFAEGSKEIAIGKWMG